MMQYTPYFDNRPSFVGIFVIFLILEITLKGMALWRSAQRGQKWWFVALFLVNSLGILPVIYLLTHKQVKAAKSSKK